MKVLHLPTSVGGNSWGLAQGEKQLGIDSEVLVLQDNWLHYPADRIVFEEATNGNSYYDKFPRLFTIIKEIASIRGKYDIYHFNFGSSMLDLGRFNLPLLDLPFYKGKIFVTYNGCDARQKYPTMERVNFSACHNEECYGGICMDPKVDKAKARKIKKFDKYADGIFALNPDLLYFLPDRAQFLPYATNLDKIKTIPFSHPKKKIKIVHAPTNRAAKGSAQILVALDKLQKKYGEIIETILVENVPNSEALKIYAQADLVIDQILIGWYGGFAVEVMKMGKPVMAYIREEDLHFIHDEMAQDCLQAIINVNPFNIFEELCNVVENPNVLKQYRKAALDYVYKWHDPTNVAMITKEAYEKACDNESEPLGIS